MKKETVSNDSLKEKIEEILTPYPDPMSRNDFRIVCHIGTRTSLYLLQSGLVPCKNNGKKTRCYKIAKKDVAEYLYRRESDPMRYTPPSGWYYNYPKHKKPAASLERKLNYKGEERLLAKEWYEQQLANYPDVLTVAQVCEVTGYQRHTILKWCSKGLLKTILQTPKYMIPKVWLLEFVTSDFFNEISRKCGKHYAAIKEIGDSSKSRWYTHSSQCVPFNFPVADWKIGWLRYTRHFSIKEYSRKNRCTALYPCRG